MKPKMSHYPTYYYFQIILIVSWSLLSRCEEASQQQCGGTKTAKAETYLETAAALIDKLRDNLPEEGGVADCSCPPKPMDCEEVLQCGRNKSGIYQIWPRNRVMTGAINVFCDQENNGGGWTIIQRRGDFKRPTDFFYKPWHKYKVGFGDLRRDFWLGNENIYAITNQKKYYLRIEMTDFANNSRYAFYDQFWIDNENQQYRLHVYDYSGDAGDSFARTHDNQMFTTLDRDNDNNTRNCAELFKGGWWYGDCHTANLNGLYNGESRETPDGVIWTTFKGASESLRTVEMKVRPMEFKTDFLDMDIDAV